MPYNSEVLAKAREAANAAFDEHCRQWDLLKLVDNPDIEDLSAWLAAKNEFIEAQDRFEEIVRQISGANG